MYSTYTRINCMTVTTHLQSRAHTSMSGAPSWGRTRCLHRVLRTVFHWGRLVSLHPGLLIPIIGHWSLRDAIKKMQAIAIMRKNRAEDNNETTTMNAVHIVEQLRSTAQAGQLASISPEFWMVDPQPPAMCGRHGAVFPQYSKEQPSPLTRCILLSLGFSSLYLVFASKSPASALTDWLIQPLNIQLQLKFFVGNRNGPQLCLSLAQEQKHLQLLLRHPGSHNPLLYFSSSERAPDVEIKIELEKGAPGDLLAEALMPAVLCDWLQRLYPTRRE